jgi:hypothetical protein
MNWNPFQSALQSIHESTWGEKKQTDPMLHGTIHEDYATRDYVQDMNTKIREEAIRQRSEQTGVFRFRGYNHSLRWNVDHSQFDLPTFECWHTGAFRDPWNLWWAVSPDFIGVIVGLDRVPVLMGEVKCLYKKKTFQLPSMFPKYYAGQPLDQLYLFSTRLWKTIQSTDTISWSPIYGFVVSTFILDPDWYCPWYLPRVFRYMTELVRESTSLVEALVTKVRQPLAQVLDTYLYRGTNELNCLDHHRPAPLPPNAPSLTFPNARRSFAKFLVNKRVDDGFSHEVRMMPWRFKLRSIMDWIQSQPSMFYSTQLRWPIVLSWNAETLGLARSCKSRSSPTLPTRWLSVDDVESVTSSEDLDHLLAAAWVELDSIVDMNVQVWTTGVPICYVTRSNIQCRASLPRSRVEFSL